MFHPSAGIQWFAASVHVGSHPVGQVRLQVPDWPKDTQQNSIAEWAFKPRSPTLTL